MDRLSSGPDLALAQLAEEVRLSAQHVRRLTRELNQALIQLSDCISQARRQLEGPHSEAFAEGAA
jgi:hypothetical protein